MAPRNVRNNNPGNIRHGGSNWNGSVKGTDQSFVTFGSPEMGVRAMTKLLYKYNRPGSDNGYNRRSVREIINKWAPPNENNTTAYVNAVAKKLGVSPDQDIDLSANPAITEKLVGAIIQHEGGNESLDHFRPSLKKGISLAKGEGQTTFPPKDVGAADSESRRILTLEEQKALTELKRARRNLDEVNADPNASPGDRADAQERFDAAKANSPFTAANDETDGSIVDDDDVSDVTFNGSNSNSNFSSSSLGNMKEVLQQTEQAGMYYENELDNYENYTYNIEFFIIPKDDAQNFLQFKDIEFEKTIRGEWPEQTIPKLIIAQSAVTTEFNIDNLVVENLGTGYGSAAKMVGIDKGLQFDITQIGDSDLNDTLNSAANLMEYVNINTATFFIKVTYNGYSYDNPTNILKLPTVKVIPFRIDKFIDLNTTTDETGTTTTISGTVSNYASVSHGVNTTKIDFNFVIGDTLQETLNNFNDELNASARAATSFSSEQSDFVNTYEIKLESDFKDEYSSTPMNGPIANKSAASNNVSKKSKTKFNVSEQIGQVPIGVSIIDLIYDILIQNVQIRQELTASIDGFSKVVRISPEIIQKKHNPVTNIMSHHTVYNISMHKEIVVQNVTDQTAKISSTNKILDEIFQTGRCRKLYNYYYTGLNDQILDLTISLDKQLTKSYSPPGNEFSWNKFLPAGMQLDNILESKQLENFNKTVSSLDDFNKKKTELSTTQQQKQEQLQKLKQEQAKSEFSGLMADLNDPNNEGDIQSTNSESKDKFFDELGKAESLSDIQVAANRHGINITEFVKNLESGEPLLQKAISKLEDDINNISDELSETTSSIRDLTLKKGADDRTTAEQVGASLAGRFSGFNSNNASTREKLLGDPTGLVLAEELKEDGDIFKKLTDAEFSDLMDAMQLNSINFMNNIIPMMRGTKPVSTFKSTDLENIELARSKLFESLNGDLSMANLSMTIKGDPFWMEFYITEDVKKQIVGKDNTSDAHKSIVTNVNGTNYLLLVVNKADGVDDFDNIKIDNLDIFLYSVKSVINTFAQGQFTQQLNCVRLPIPDNFKRVETGDGKLDTFGGPGNGPGGSNGINPFGDSSFGSDSLGEFAGADGSGINPFGDSLFGSDPLGEFGGSAINAFRNINFGDETLGEFAGVANNLVASIPNEFQDLADVAGIPSDITDALGRDGAIDPSTIAKNSFRNIDGSLATEAHNFISSNVPPQSSDASRLAALMNEAEMAAALGSPEAAAAVEKIKNDIRNKYGNTEDASDFLQQQVDTGEIVSPELVAFLNTKVYADNTTEVIPPNNISDVDVSNIMTEIQTIEGMNSLSVDELIETPTKTLMTPTVDMSPNADVPSSLRIETSNLMLGGLLPIESTETYTDPRPPVVDYNIQQLESLDLPDDVVDGYKEVADTRNGIKVRKYLDTLPPDQVKLLNEIDNPYTVTTLPADPPVTTEKIINTPMKTPREAIMQARIQDAQTQMIAEAGGSYNDLSVDEKRHYNNLSDAYDEIDEVAQLDPIRNEAKLLKINNELDKSIRVYNDRLSGGDSEWSWNDVEAQVLVDIRFGAQNDVASLSYSPNEFTAERIRVNPDGSIVVDLDSESMPTSPSAGYVLPINAITDIPVEDFTEEHLAQYESANAVMENLFTSDGMTITKAVTPDGDSVTVVTGFTNTDLASVYNIPFSPNVLEGDVVDTSSTTILTRQFLESTKQNIADSYPLIGTRTQSVTDYETWKEFIITDPTQSLAETPTRVYKDSRFFSMVGNQKIYAGSELEKSLIESDIVTNTASKTMIDYYNKTFGPDWNGFRWIKAE
jgi:hypothetical protein